MRQCQQRALSEPFLLCVSGRGWSTIAVGRMLCRKHCCAGNPAGRFTRRFSKRHKREDLRRNCERKRKEQEGGGPSQIEQGNRCVPIEMSALCFQSRALGPVIAEASPTALVHLPGCIQTAGRASFHQLEHGRGCVRAPRLLLTHSHRQSPRDRPRLAQPLASQFKKSDKQHAFTV